MKYFTIKELCASSTAQQKKINNEPTKEVIKNLELLVENILDPLRDMYEKPIIINSGYRSPELNKIVGGAKTSQHVYGLAADITGGSVKENKFLFNAIIGLELPFDQVIDEKNYSWIHVSYSKNPRNQILHL